MTEIDAGELVLRPVGRDVARALLAGRMPAGMVLAPGSAGWSPRPWRGTRPAAG